MTWWMYTLVAIVGLALLGLIVVLVFGRTGRLPSSRFGRLLHIGNLSARLSASFVGASVRRLFAGHEGRARIDEARRKADAARVAETMGHMKGAFMKLGQMMSFISDNVPAEFQAALKQLQSDSPPMDFPLVRDTVERELGKPLERAFAHFEPRPLAAASIGQVHRAQLPSGEEVVVKVQYPGVADAIRADLSNMEMLQRALTLMYPAHDPVPVIEELRGRIFEEFDYRNEARNQEEFRALYDGHPGIRIPRSFPAYSTEKILTSEFVAGRRFEEVCGDDQARRDRYAEIIYRFVFGSIMRHRLFNGDPHPGNYLFDPDGKVVFLDFGCTKRFPEDMAHVWAELISSHFQGDHEAFRRGAIALGFLKDETPISADLLYDYFELFYQPFRFDREFAFSREYIASTFRQVFAPGGKFSGMQKMLTMPGHFVFVNRIQWGVFSILGHLGARQNFHRIHREYLYGDPPATPLGEADRAFWAQKGVAVKAATARPSAPLAVEPPSAAVAG